MSEPTSQSAYPTLCVEGEMTETDRDWIEQMMRAWSIMQERQAARSDVWRRSGARGMAHELFAKAERLFDNLMSGEPDIEQAMAELPDIINYAVFCSMQVRLNNLNGSWPWPS
jgi:hypothetical protein